MGSYCLFCYKPSLQDRNFSVDSKCQVNSAVLLNQFVKHLNCELSDNASKYSSAGKNYAGACVSCVRMLEAYCDLRVELECVQMKIHWQLNKLKQVMQQAAKVSSRVTDFKENVFPDFKFRQEELDNVLNLRKSIYRECSKRVRQQNPVVRLADQTAAKVVKCEKQEIVENFQEQDDFLQNQEEPQTNGMKTNWSELDLDDMKTVVIANRKTHCETTPKKSKNFDSSSSPEVTLTVTVSDDESDTSQNISDSSSSSSASSKSDSSGQVKKKLKSSFKCGMCQRRFISRSNLMKHKTSEKCKRLESSSDSETEDDKPRKRRKVSRKKPSRYSDDSSWENSSFETTDDDSASSLDDTD